MANSYTMGTGMVIAEKMTPFLSLFFGPFAIERYSEKGFYIATSDDSQPTANGFADDVLTELGSDDRKYPDGMESDMEKARYLLLEKVKEAGFTLPDGALDFMNTNDEYDVYELETAFMLAEHCNDGHNIASAYLNCAYYCDKMRLNEFGGYAAYMSKALTVYGGTDGELRLAVSLDEALSRSPEAAAQMIFERVDGMLENITNVELRERVREFVLSDRNPAPQERPETPRADGKETAIELSSTYTSTQDWTIDPDIALVYLTRKDIERFKVLAGVLKKHDIWSIRDGNFGYELLTGDEDEGNMRPAELEYYVSEATAIIRQTGHVEFSFPFKHSTDSGSTTRSWTLEELETLMLAAEKLAERPEHNEPAPDPEKPRMRG